jgi:hypothetical protein
MDVLLYPLESKFLVVKACIRRPTSLYFVAREESLTDISNSFFNFLWRLISYVKPQSIVEGDVDDIVIATCKEACWVAHGILVTYYVPSSKDINKNRRCRRLVLNETAEAVGAKALPPALLPELPLGVGLTRTLKC